MKRFTFPGLLVILSFSIYAQVNYDESVSGDLSSNYAESFDMSVGSNHWTGTIYATPPSNADTWIAVVQDGEQLSTIHYEHGPGEGLIVFVFDACSSGLPTTNLPSLDGLFIPPLGPGNYCVQILTDFNTFPVTWDVVLGVESSTDPCEGVGGDSDGDGVCDNNDDCPNDPNKIEPGTCGCGVVDVDTDADGLADCDDNCPDDPNLEQADLDGDGIGDICDDIVNVGGAGGTIIDSIENIGLQPGLENALIVKIQNALASCANGNENAALNQLNSFINQVNAKRGNELTDEQADQLIAMAQALIVAIENGTADCGSGMPFTASAEPLNPIETGRQAAEKWLEENDPVGYVGLIGYPNPADGIVNFRFDLRKELPVSFYIYDLYGQQKMVLLQNVIMEKGSHQVSWTPGNEKGIFIGKLIVAEHQTELRFVVGK